MSPLELFFLLRRHRLVLFAAVLAGVVAGWLTAPGSGDEAQEYEATTTLLVADRTGSLNLAQAALRVDTGDVPVQAAQAIGVDVGTLTRVVDATAAEDIAALLITGRSEDPTLAQNSANAVATALIERLTGGRLQQYNEEVQKLTDRSAELRAQISGGAGGPGAQVDVDAAQSELSATLQQLGALTSQGPPGEVLRVLEGAVAREAEAEGIQAPDSKPVRAALLGGFGLLIGIAAVFALDRLDTRIHTKAGAEAAFGYPVIAEIPPLPAGAHRQLLSASHPGSQFVEAYRGLRSYVALAGASKGLAEPALGEGTVILVTSPLAGEGKTTSVAHLAAMLGEVGRSVLVVSADFRRPRLHELFDRERAPGLTEVLQGVPNAPDLAHLNLSTGAKGVEFLTSGSPISNPAVVVKRTPALLKAAQTHWDFIVVDSAPLLVANDTTELARASNGVVLLARSGRTTVDAAERTAELLRRIEAPVIGIVLIAANESPTAYRYYRKGYYAETEEPRKRHWWQLPRRRAARPPDRPPASGNGTANGAWVPSERPPGRVPS